MKALLQRVKSASVAVNDITIGKINRGYAVLLGVCSGDSEKEAVFLADKTAKLRVFADEAGKMNLSLLDKEGEALVVSQFTLCADCRKGRRPSFVNAEEPDISKKLYTIYIEELKKLGVKVQTGEFGADMTIFIENDGPVTIMLDTKEIMPVK